MIPTCAEGKLRAVVLNPDHGIEGESHFEDARRDFTSLTYSTRLNGWGAFSGAVMWAESPLSGLLLPHYILVVYRTPAGDYEEYIDFAGIIRRVETFTASTDITYKQIYGREADSILGRYEIEPPVGLAYNDKTGIADNVLKEYVRDECVDDPTKVFPHFSVGVNTSQSATTLSRSIRYKRLSDIIKNIRDAADDFDFKVTISDDLSEFIFDTYYPQFGLDRRIGSASPLVFSMDNRNMRLPMYWQRGYDATSKIMVLGGGQAENRAVVSVEDPDTEALWGFCEQSYDARSEDDADLASVGAGVLKERGPTSGLDFEIINSPYGGEWKLGYRVSAEYAGIEADYLIDEVRVVINSEQLESPVEAISPNMKLLEIRA